MQQVCGRVILAREIALLGIHAGYHGRSHRRLAGAAGAEVHDHRAGATRIAYLEAERAVLRSNDSTIAALAATLGVERRVFEHHGPLVARALDKHHRCGRLVGG